MEIQQILAARSPFESRFESIAMLSPIKSTKRAFEIFEYFQIMQRPLSLQTISKALQYPASSASVLLKSLVALGYLDYDKDRRKYLPTMKIADLGSWVQSAVFGDGRIAGLMDRLSAKFGETVTLAVQSDLYAQYLYLVPSRLPIWYRIPIGTLRPLTSSGSGLMLLSRKSETEIEKIVKRINFHQLDAARPELDVILEMTRNCRTDGHIFSKHSIEPGAGGISVLLPEDRFGRSLALGVHGPVDRLEPQWEAIVAALRRAAAPAAD